MDTIRGLLSRQMDILFELKKQNVLLTLLTLILVSENISHTKEKLRKIWGDNSQILN